jgi:hypothetical protein
MTTVGTPAGEQWHVLLEQSARMEPCPSPWALGCCSWHWRAMSEDELDGECSRDEDAGDGDRGESHA